MSEQATGSSCRWPGGAGDQSGFPDPEQDLVLEAGTESAEMVVAGGCFWCVDAVFRRLGGVLASECGYCGGSAATARYERVCGGDTGHAEAVRLRYDPQQISFGALLKIFFSVAHDPTQHNRQGHDVGPQYRSAVFYAHERQRAVASAYIAQLDAAGIFSAPIATTLEPLEIFYPAEPEHQAYAERHPEAGYIRIVAQPKLEKLGTAYAAQLRD